MFLDADEAHNPPGTSFPPCPHAVHEFFKEHDKVPKETPDFPGLNSTKLSGWNCKDGTQPEHILTLGSALTYTASWLVRAEVHWRQNIFLISTIQGL